MCVRSTHNYNLFVLTNLKSQYVFDCSYRTSHVIYMWPIFFSQSNSLKNIVSLVQKKKEPKFKTNSKLIYNLSKTRHYNVETYMSPLIH